MRSLLAFDPGGTTGWSFWEYDPITPLRPVAHGQIGGGVEGFVEWWQENVGSGDLCPDNVVAESFRLDGRTPYPDVTPLKIEGALAVLWPTFALQPNVMKSHMRDAKIKSLGLWWPGEPHAIDSLRHAFAYMKVRKHMPTLMVAFPPPVGGKLADWGKSIGLGF